jgi:hypothetical protein
LILQQVQKVTLNMSKHHAKIHHWIDGILKTFEHSFDSFEEALNYIKLNESAHAKIYDDERNLVHSETLPLTPAVNSYA